eukprot:5468870-Pleurochrysis_carterae.AAC.2
MGGRGSVEATSAKGDEIEGRREANAREERGDCAQSVHAMSNRARGVWLELCADYTLSRGRKQRATPPLLADCRWVWRLLWCGTVEMEQDSACSPCEHECRLLHASTTSDRPDSVGRRGGMDFRSLHASKPAETAAETRALRQHDLKALSCADAAPRAERAVVSVRGSGNLLRSMLRVCCQRVSHFARVAFSRRWT